MKAQSSDAIVQELKKTEVFKNSTKEELNKIAESLIQFSIILFELYNNQKFRENEQREPNQRHPKK